MIRANGGANAGGRGRTLDVLERLPPFSPVFNQLLATIADEDVSFADVAAVIERDTVLAGNVLRLVNSPLYGVQGAVNSVRHAIAVLGLNKLRNVALGMSVARLWANTPLAPGWSQARFNLHSVATGILADLLAPGGAVENPECAFTAGLMHDLGKALIAAAMPAEYAAITRKMAADGSSWADCEVENGATPHWELSELALRHWNLPEPICAAVAAHHRPPAGSLSAVVSDADRLANALGHSVVETEAQRAEISGYPACILDQFDKELQTLKGFV